MKFDVWLLGRKNEPATYHGEYEAGSFRDAVRRAVQTFSEPHRFNESKLTYRGLRFFWKHCT